MFVLLFYLFQCKCGGACFSRLLANSNVPLLNVFIFRSIHVRMPEETVCCNSIESYSSAAKELYSRANSYYIQKKSFDRSKKQQQQQQQHIPHTIDCLLCFGVSCARCLCVAFSFDIDKKKGSKSKRECVCLCLCSYSCVCLSVLDENAKHGFFIAFFFGKMTIINRTEKRWDRIQVWESVRRRLATLSFSMER